MSKHTPGPWMAAASPSSIVGWPVVGPMGRSIASVHCAVLQPSHVSDEAWQAYREECAANAKVIGAAADLVTALLDAMTWHEENDKALSKQPPSFGPSGSQWMRLQHREQIANIRAALEKAGVSP